MHVYRVDYGGFFDFSDSPDIRPYFDRNHALSHEPMTQLIKRYGLQKKTVLSVGASFGYQEYCFYENGCALTLCDMDEGSTIEPRLKTLKAGDLAYALGDVRELDAGKFDAVFFSGFTPNELRNRHQGKLQRFLGKPIWHDAPFHDIVIDAVDKSLAKDGLFIFQSYASDVDASKPEYVSAVKRQLAPLGIGLVDLYYYETRPHVHLIIAARGKAPELQSGEITAFHGRGEQAGAVKKSYP